MSANLTVTSTVAAMQEMSLGWRRSGLRVGLVPTMGALHGGHLALIRRADELSDRVVVSIFVNPSQFGEHEDYSSYPRDLGGDLRACRAHGVAAVFAPPPEEMYAPDFSTWVTEEALSRPLCGKFRPGHFRGVATVVVKLFNAVQPEVALFGQKDIQQALVLERVVRDLNLPVGLEMLPIVREGDGLAMSSRNCGLSADQRRRATSIFQGLESARHQFAEGERAAAVLTAIVSEKVRMAGGRIEYAEARSRENLEMLATIDRPAVLAVAAWFGQVRLIDNCLLFP